MSAHQKHYHFKICAWIILLLSHGFLTAIFHLTILDTKGNRKLENLSPPALRMQSKLRETPPIVVENRALSQGCTNQVSIAHKPRYDLTGSFTLPTILLLAIAHRYDWTLEIAPFAGSSSEKTLQHLVDMGPELQDMWPTESSGMGDASNRKDFDPIQLNKDVYDALGFFPKESTSFNESDWIQLEEIPGPGAALEKICSNDTRDDNEIVSSITPRDGCTPTCRLFMSDDPVRLKKHMLRNGGYEAFFTESLRKSIFEEYSKANRHRLPNDFWLHYNIAIHVRRGEILNPQRWTSQEAFATVARRICSEQQTSNTNTTVHVFSSGDNRDGNWTELENIMDTCNDVVFHLDEYEFDTWAYFVFADELVISKSTFSYVPALISVGKVHSPDDFWHVALEHWKIFRNNDGTAVQ